MHDIGGIKYKMKVSFLTSWFSDGFTKDFMTCINEYYKSNGSFVFIASDFTDYIKTDKNYKNIISTFNENNIEFTKSYIIDDRTSKEEASKFIEDADIVWISGGDTLKQIKYIKEYNLIKSLQKRDGITIGMSAGSINMAKRVVLAKDVTDNIPELSIYEGIGLVDINIEPHLASASDEHINDLNEAAMHSDIYGIYDNSFIKVIGNKFKIYGDYKLFEKR